MPYATASAAEIDKKLRDDFRSRVKDFGMTAEVTDPILAVLFRTFARELEQLYAETDRIRLSLLDELIANLSVGLRMARPAQTVVRFSSNRGSQLIAAGTELVGETEGGERLTFLTDESTVVSEARIAFGFMYQDGMMRMLSMIELPEALQALRASLDPVRVDLGPNPCIFLAIENLPPEHLSEHSFFFELGPDAYRIQQALETETWCLINSEGNLNAEGIFRSRAVNGGVRSLQLLLPPNGERQSSSELELEIPFLPTGYYGPRTFLLPVIPPSRRFRCRVPRALDAPLAKIFGRDYAVALADERAWTRISMPPGIPALHTALDGILLHAMTASNVECFNQTIAFDKHGTSIPIEEGCIARHLVAPLSIFGESGNAYLPDTEPSTQEGSGRYAIRNGRIELRPGWKPDGSRESYANLRLWVTHGRLGNSVGVNQLTTFLKRNNFAELQLTNPTSAAGGTDREEMGTAQTRLADALLSRDRIVTRNDLTNAVRSFDSRILAADVMPGVCRTKHGLQRIDRVTVRINQNDFVDPHVELPILRDDLYRHLARRLPMDTELAVDVREA